MELLLGLFMLLLVALGSIGLLTWVPFGRWTFEYGGRTFEVRNYGVREVILVDGVVVEHTGVSTNWTTKAAHAIKLPDGRQLEIVIASSNGLTIDCIARVGDEVVFDSTVHRVPEGAARATLPGTLEPDPPSTEPDDARWAPARVLLDELEATPELAESARALRGALHEALDGLQRATRAADAHQALGGAGDDLDAVVQHREDSVQEVLGLLRELHLAATTRDVRAPSIEDTLGRLEAEREVDEAALRRAAAQRARASERNR